MKYQHPIDKQCRKAGISRRRLAERADLSATFLDRLTTRGRRDAVRRPSDFVLERLAAVLECEPRDLYDPSWQQMQTNLPEHAIVVLTGSTSVQSALIRAAEAYNHDHSRRYLVAS
jgi:DNA-binding Xre family transcriptional regulator